MAKRLGLKPIRIETNWRRGVDQAAIEAALCADEARRIRAVCVVHNETSTGCVSPIKAIGDAIDSAGHTALLLVGAIFSLASSDYRHDESAIDVTVAGSQKGLMLRPGLSFNAVGARARSKAKLARSHWDWRPMLERNEGSCPPNTPATNMLRGLQKAPAMLEEEALPNMVERRWIERPRAAVEAWSQSGAVDRQCQASTDYSASLAGARLAKGHSADPLRALILRQVNMRLGDRLRFLEDRSFRIGHLGDLNELTLIGPLSGIEMGLRLARPPHGTGGVDAAKSALAE